MNIPTYTCSDCAHTFREPEQLNDTMLPACPKCGSCDIHTPEPIVWDDAYDEQRMREIRAESAQRYADMDRAYELREEHALMWAEMDAVADAQPTFEVGFMTRRQAGGL